MANPSRLKLIQAAQARMMRNKPKKPKRESAAEELAEPLGEETAESPEYERREHGGSAPKRIPRTAGDRP